MDEITIGDKVYVSSKRASKITGYAKDYVGQLCREGRVEARLVGRNWYVLETSIREHRFGLPQAVETPEKEEMPVSPVSEWNAPRYESVTAPVIPPFTPKTLEKTTEEAPIPEPESLPEEPLAPPDNERVVEDMQEAWREWFNREEPSVATDDNEETDQEETTDSFEEESEPVQLSRIQSVETVTVEPEYVPRRSAVVDLSPKHSIVEVPQVQEEEAIVAPRRARQRNNKKRRTGSSIIVRTLFFSVAALAVLVAFVGSGYADSLLHIHGNNNVQQNVIDYLQGTTVLNK